ncbi:MAG: group I intron-associated PD-(D/E)XK endonuclease [Clostridia bacterium]
MIFKSNKEKGNAGLGIAIAYYSANGYTVSIPLNDTQDYDLIVDKNNVLKKVQVKATSCKTKYNKYQVALKSCGGTKGETYKTIIDTKIDEVFVVTDTMEMFIIPIEEIKNKTTLNLCEKYEKNRVKI